MNGIVVHDGVAEGKLGREDPGQNCTPESGPSALITPTVKLSRKELRDISGSYDRLDERHAAGKSSKQQLLYLNFPLEPDVPKETCPVVPRELVIRDAVIADSDVRDDWVSELLQNVADFLFFL